MSDHNEANGDHGARVREMFGKIAGRYDLLNHLLSANIDKRWRRQVADRLEKSLQRGATILDVACGTGDLSLALSNDARARVFALDFCRPMLDIAVRKSRAASAGIFFVEGDALRLPFEDEDFDAVTIAFGLRNLSSIEAGLRELRRVMKRGGEIAVLEFSKPLIPGFNTLFQFYFTHVLPRMGGIISHSQTAYEYLPESVSRFPDQEALANLMHEAGFKAVHYNNLTWGIAAVHYGQKGM